MDLIKNKVSDQAFIDLMYKNFKAGYGVTSSKLVRDKNGIPQGNVLSPLLANIYLHELDTFMEHIKEKYNKGIRRRANPEYTKMIRTGKVDRSKIIHPLMRNDNKFIRVQYIRYADDFIIGINGSKETAALIREEINQFLKNRLNLDLNLSKTIISHTTKDGANFLGYKIFNTPFEKQPLRYNLRKGVKKLIRITPRMQITAPVDTIAKRLKDKGFCVNKSTPTRNGKYVYLTHNQIINIFKRIENGLLSYYKLASNYGRMAARVHYILKYSCILTLTSKYRLRTKKRTISKMGLDLSRHPDNIGGISYDTPSYAKPKLNKNNSNIPINRDPMEIISTYSRFIERGRRELIAPCFACGSEEKVEIHHIKHLKKGKSRD